MPKKNKFEQLNFDRVQNTLSIDYLVLQGLPPPSSADVLPMTKLLPYLLLHPTVIDMSTFKVVYNHQIIEPAPAAPSFITN